LDDCLPKLEEIELPPRTFPAVDLKMRHLMMTEDPDRSWAIQSDVCENMDDWVFQTPGKSENWPVSTQH
jgi:hypothetical protein